VTELDLDAIEARANAATPGPWEHGERCVWQAGMLNTAEIAVDCEHGNGGIRRHADAEFIAHARTDVPALLAEVKRLREQVERMRGLLEAAGPIHLGCPNLQKVDWCPWCRITELETADA
jgi:hypothetical protein